MRRASASTLTSPGIGQGADRPGRLPEPHLVAARDRHPGAALDQQPRHIQADAAAAAGHEHLRIVELHWVVLSLGRWRLKVSAKPGCRIPRVPDTGGSVHFSGRLGGAAAAPEHGARATRQLARGERSISAEVGDVTGRILGIAGPLRDIERGTRD